MYCCYLADSIYILQSAAQRLQEQHHDYNLAEAIVPIHFAVLAELYKWLGDQAALGSDCINGQDLLALHHVHAYLMCVVISAQDTVCLVVECTISARVNALLD